MSIANASISFESVPRGNIREAVVRRILTAVMMGKFPAGHRMVVQRLAEQFGVSATPVREALVELALIGIVENLPNRGAVMREFGPVQIWEIYQLRRILEVEAIRCACGRIDREELEELQRAFVVLDEAPHDDLWSQQAMELDVRLHEAIAANCGSCRLQDELQRYGTLVQDVRQVVGNERQAQEIAIAQHKQIILALLAGDADSAAEAMTQHIQSTAGVVVEAMYSRP